MTAPPRQAGRCRLASLIVLVATVLVVRSPPVIGQERLAHESGEFEFRLTSTGVLINAPHSTYDANTAPLAIEEARRLGAGYVVARRFTVDGTRLNVNRPTEGAGLACRQEPHTARAKELDRVFFTAACAKSLGIFGTDLVPRVAHFEFPRSARDRDTLEATTLLIAEIVLRLVPASPQGVRSGDAERTRMNSGDSPHHRIKP